MLEKTEFEKAVSRLSAHVKTSFTVRDDGTIDVSDSAYDATGINDYILMLVAREQETAKRAFDQGRQQGYHEAMQKAPRPLRGDFGFTNGTQKFLVWVGNDYIEAREVKNGNLHVMQEISKAEVYK